MSWLAQAWHVLAKDVRQVRWFLAAYVALVALATLRAAEALPLSAPLYGSVPLIVVAVGVLLAAAVVQADSPTRSDAFWATHPFRPTALAGAKLGFGVLILVVGLVGQAIALLSYRVGGAETASLLLSSIPAFAGWLLIGLVLAAVLRDLRTVALTFVFAPVLYAVIAVPLLIGRPGVPGGAPADDMGGSALAWATVRTVFALAAVILLAWLYRERDGRLRTRLAAGALAVVLLMTMRVSAPAALRASDAPPVEAIPLVLQWPTDLHLLDETLTLPVRTRDAALPRNVQLVLDRPLVVARLVDGTVLRFRPAWMRGRTTMTGSTRPVLPGTRWLGEPDRHELSGFVSAHTTPEQRRALSRGVATLALEGRAVLVETRPMTTLPLVPGAGTRVPGQRARVESWERAPHDVALEIETKTVTRTTLEMPGSGQFSANEGCVLVNEARGEGVVLQRRGVGGSADALVLPGVSLSRQTKECAWAPQRTGRGPTPSLADLVHDAAWFDDAHLVLVDHAVVGSFPFRIEVEAPSSPPAR